MKSKAALMACAGMLAFTAAAFTTASVPSDGVYKFTFGVSETQDGSVPVPASAVCDVKDETLESGKFSYGFLGTTDTSYIDDIPWSLGEPRAIDGFSVVSGQKIVLRNAADANGVSCVAGPAKSEYLPAGASDYEGRYPIRFAMRGEEYAYYAVTCTVANASSTANADVTLFSERTHIITHHLSLAPGETKTFAWSVELAPNVYKTQGTYRDDCVNVCVVGENAAIASLTVAKRPQIAGTVRGEAVDNMNVGRTMWLCTDSTGTDQAIATPFFSLQNYAGVGSGLSRWAPANLSIRNQGEGGLATNANAHRQSCRLKPGDYLYVEYGHNESGVTSFTNNLETYLSDANAAGAYLVIVSPVERRNSWDGATSTWGRSLQGIAEAGEAWVEDKIAQGARNVAFIDLNKKYNVWMNDELRRINGVNGDVSLNAAISFYYRSAKGANVDNTHINTAGADWAAYWVWQDALERVAAGENAEEESAAKVQSDVLKGITDGCQLKVGVGGTVDNTPWLVADEIINAGPAPNSFWDTPVSEGYAYVNDAAVANVEATANADGTVTITGVTMRILNPNNYYKSVIEVFSASGLSQGVYYSYYNYDIGGAGKVSGDLVNPNQPGFLTSDRGKDDVSAADVESITVPAGGKALVWIAEADAGTWQVGENAPCSAKYPVEWWSDVIFDNDCSSLDGWAVNSQAVNEYSLSDKGGIYFMSAGASSDNTKKNYGFYHQFDNAAQMTNGRYRVSFKVMMDSGHITWQLFNSLGTTTNPFNGTGTAILDIRGTTLTSYAGSAPQFTLGDEDAPLNIVNKLRWIDVDAIIDRDNDRAWVSAGGSDYVEYQNAAFLPGGYAGTTWKYFGMSCESQMSSYGYVDDVKIVKLASVEYPTVTAKATCNAEMGSVTINGYDTDALSIYSGNDFMIRATSADPDFYAFQNWTDGEGNVISTDANLFIENASEDISLTANFREYARSENRVVTWDFSAYQGDFEVTASDATTITDNGMDIYLTSGDTMTADGLVWKDSAISKSGDALSSSAHHIEFTPAASGTLTLKFSVDSYNSGRKPTMLVKAAESSSECSTANGDVTVVTAAADTEYTLSANLTAGTKYFIWTYAYNWSGAGYHHNYTIPSITYTYIPVFDATFDVAGGETSVRANAIANNANVTKSGTGTLVLLGNSDFSGSLFVNAGTLKLGTPTDIPGATADFDVSAVNAVETINDVLTWKDSLPDSVNTLENVGVQPGLVEEAATMNGRPALKGASFRMDMGCAVSAKTTILAMHPFCGTTSWNVLMVDDESYSITCRNSSPWNRKGSSNSAYYGTDGIWQNGVDVDGKTQTTPMVMSIVGQWTKSDPACINIGWNNSSGTQAYSELLTYSRELAEAERVAVEEYLMSKWGIGNVAYAPIPASAGVEIATGATLDLGGMTQTVASLSVAAGGVVTNGTLIVASAPSIDEQAFAAATDNGDGTWSVVWKDVDIEVDTHTFVWNWNVASGDWNDPANWLYEGIVPATTCPTDTANDYVTFNTAAKVKLGDGASAKAVWLNDAVTFTNGTLTASLVTKYEDDGRAILANAGFANPKNLAAEISCPVVMTAGTINWFNKISDGDWKEWMTVSGNISGEGRYNVNLANVQGNGVKFTGNNNGFHGDVYTYGGKSNRSVINWSTNAVGTNSFLHVGHSYGTYNGDSYRMGADVKFGGVDGGWWDRYDGALLTIGYLNRDSVINISNGVGGRANSVAKVGNANLTLGTKTIKDLTIIAGSVTMPVGIAPQTLTIAEGAKIIIVGDATWEENTTTNLFSYATLAGTGASSLASQIELTGLAGNLGAEFIIDTENRKVVARIVKKAAPEPSTVAVFLVGGQSNTEGRIPNGDLPGYLASNECALVSDHSMVSDSTELGTFAAWAPTGKWAYDTEVYYRLAQALNEEFYVVKTSYGGTSVHPGVNNSPSGHENAWLPGYGSGYHWSADEDFLAATVSAGRTFVKDDVTYDGQSMLKAWIENIDAAIDAIVAAGNTPDVKAIIWHQGESDNNNGNYASNLTAVVTYVRQHLATKLGDDKCLALPFFCGNIPRRSSLFKAGLDRQFKAIEATADNNMHVVDIYDLTMLSDAKHFDAASAITFGKRLFNRMIDEGVIEGEKVEVEDCVRVPDFGVEHVVNNTTTWTFSGMTETIGVLTNVAGLYFRPENSGSRGFKSMGLSKSLSFSIGDTTPIDVTRGFYTCGRGYGSRITESSSAGGNESGLVTMLAMNAGRAGRFEIFGLSNASDVKMRVYFNGTLVDSGEAVGDKGTLLGVSARNAGKGTYYIDLSGYIYVLAARFVPDGEMPSVTLSIGADGWTTFGNLYESNFELPNGVKAYAVSPVDGNPTLLAMSEVGTVNIGGAVVVNGPAGSYTLEPDVGAAFGGENLMVVQEETGVLAPTSGSDFFNFEFKVQDGKPVFIRAQGDATLDAGKAFFSITEGDEHSQQSTLRFHEAGGSDESGMLVRANSAESAAAMVNPPTRPSEAASAVTEEAYAAYFTNTAVAKAGAEGVFVVTVLLDRNVVGPDDTLATVSSVELSDADSASLTLSNVKPGLYYSLVGGAHVESIATEGQRSLAMSGTVSLSKPEIESDSPARFYRVKVSSTSGL